MKIEKEHKKLSQEERDLIYSNSVLEQFLPKNLSTEMKYTKIW